MDSLGDLQEAGEKERELREEFGLSADYLPEIHVHDECLGILETFREIDNRLGGWEIRFQELVDYKQEHGNCLVPQSWEENQPLAKWVSRQRTTKKKGQLDDDKIKRLEELGFVWDPRQQAWEDQFQEMVAYKHEYGNCLVPKGRGENKVLASWVNFQRTTKKKDKLDADKIKRLDELGFVWEPDQQAWEDRFQELVAYKREHGDCLVPRKGGNLQLGLWVSKQRGLKRRDKLDADKIKRLDELGFVWDTRK